MRTNWLISLVAVVAIIAVTVPWAGVIRFGLFNIFSAVSLAVLNSRKEIYALLYYYVDDNLYLPKGVSSPQDCV